MNTALLFTADEEFMKEDKGMEKEKDMEDEEEDSVSLPVMLPILSDLPYF